VKAVIGPRNPHRDLCINRQIDLLVVSPLKRTLETAVLAFEKVRRAVRGWSVLPPHGNERNKPMAGSGGALGGPGAVPRATRPQHMRQEAADLSGTTGVPHGRSARLGQARAGSIIRVACCHATPPSRV
jgi:hypothetical protein